MIAQCLLPAHRTLRQPKIATTTKDAGKLTDFHVRKGYIVLRTPANPNGGMHFPQIDPADALTAGLKKPPEV